MATKKSVGGSRFGGSGIVVEAGLEERRRLMVGDGREGKNGSCQIFSPLKTLARA